MKVIMRDFGPREKEAITRIPTVTKEVRRKAGAVRTLARRNAPKQARGKSKGGARSIQVQRWYDKATRTVAFRVTWDRAHYYMVFNEEGSQTNRARHFLQRAAEQVQRGE